MTSGLSKYQPWCINIVGLLWVALDRGWRRRGRWRRIGAATLLLSSPMAFSVHARFEPKYPLPPRQSIHSHHLLLPLLQWCCCCVGCDTRWEIFDKAGFWLGLLRLDPHLSSCYLLWLLAYGNGRGHGWLVERNALSLWSNRIPPEQTIIVFHKE